MKTYNKQVSIIIVSYNTKNLTIKCIKSIFEKTKKIDYEIIVVDNASQDGSLEELRNIFQNKIRIIESKENLGFGKANNLGIKQSQGKYIFLLNSDTKLINNAVKIFYDYMEQNEQVAVCGGNLYNTNDIPEESYRMYKGNIYSYFYNRYLELLFNFISKFNKKKCYCKFNYSNKVKEVGYITGADMFIKKSVLDKVGLFDENIFMYAEDADLNFRIKKEGYCIKSIPQAKIYHYLSKSSKNITNKYNIVFDGTYYVYFKYFGNKTYFIYLDTELTLLRKVISSFFSNKTKYKEYVEIMKINKNIYLKHCKKHYEN